MNRRTSRGFSMGFTATPCFSAVCSPSSNWSTPDETSTAWVEAAAADSVSRWKRALALDLEATVVLAAREEGKRDGIRPWRRSGRMGWAVTGIAHCIFPHQSLAAPFSPHPLSHGGSGGLSAARLHAQVGLPMLPFSFQNSTASSLHSLTTKSTAFADHILEIHHVLP